MEIELTINQRAVLDEVAQATEYTGAKMTGDEGAYERIGTIDENEPELLRFWDESRAEVVQAFGRLLDSEGMDGEGRYSLRLNVSEAFSRALLPSMEIGLFSYYVQSIAAKWYAYTNKGEVEAYAQRAAALLEEVRMKAFSKAKPTRPARKA